MSMVPLPLPLPLPVATLVLCTRIMHLRAMPTLYMVLLLSGCMAWHGMAPQRMADGDMMMRIILPFSPGECRHRDLSHGGRAAAASSRSK